MSGSSGIAPVNSGRILARSIKSDLDLFDFIFENVLTRRGLFEFLFFNFDSIWKLVLKKKKSRNNTYFSRKQK